MPFLMARPTKLPGSRHPYARKVVPADVRAILGRTEFKRPLHGGTCGERRQQHAEALAEWEAEIEAARAQVRGQAPPLTLRDTDALIGQWYRAELADRGEEPGTVEALALELDVLSDSLDRDGSLSNPRQDVAAARAYLRGQGVTTDKASLQRFAERWTAGKLRLAVALARRADGDWSPDANLARFPQPASKAPQGIPGGAAAPEPAPDATPDVLTFEAMVTAWAAERQPAAATRSKYGQAFKSLAAVAGHDDARRIQVPDIRRFKEARQAAGRHPKTIKNDVEAIGTVFVWAITNAMLPGPNPAARMAPRLGRGQASSRDGYTDAEARTILEAARKEAGWKRWLPWLLAFTGARIGELADLQRADVRRDGGVWMLDIRPDRQLKTENAARMLPLHPSVMAEGFLAYVTALPAGGPLFPDLPVGPSGLRTDYATAKHGLWMRNQVGITDPRKAPAHSWRHRMEDALRMVRAHPEAADAITGRRNPRNAGAGYGRGFRGMPAETLKELSQVPSPLDMKAEA